MEPLDLARAIFLNKNGEARCGWRIVLFVLAFVVAGLLFSGMVTGIASVFPSLKDLAFEPSTASGSASRGELVFLASDKIISLVAAAASTLLCANLLERRSFGSVGFKLHKGWARDLAVGSAVGALALTGSIVVLRFAGAVSFQRYEHELPLATSLFYSLA